MPASIVHTLLLLAALSAASCCAAPVGAASPGALPAQAAAPAQLLLAPDRSALQGLGLRLDDDGGGALLRLALQPEPGFAVELADGAPTRILDGGFAVPGLALRRHDGVRGPALRLVPAPGRSLDLDLVDGVGAVWLRVRFAMRSPEPADGLRLITADLRGGPALAAFTGRDAEGLLLGNVELRATLSLPPATGAFAKSCAAPNWPTDPGTVTDVHLLNIDTVDVLRCRAPGEPGCSTSYGCDGPGGLDGEVVVVPSATLRNSDAANAADVPWYRKFSGYFPPYALPEGNDQHPYL
ncbi:MAG TPA: hypothetical protein VFG21_00340, partial [Xanthomonadaceae bacterium]|nr:hypothetical protein [Xanthomonadaceae bacterium]